MAPKRQRAAENKAVKDQETAAEALRDMRWSGTEQGSAADQLRNRLVALMASEGYSIQRLLHVLIQLSSCLASLTTSGNKTKGLNDFMDAIGVMSARVGKVEQEIIRDVKEWVRRSPGKYDKKLRNLIKIIELINSQPPESHEAAKRKYRKKDDQDPEGGGGGDDASSKKQQRTGRVATKSKGAASGRTAEGGTRVGRVHTAASEEPWDLMAILIARFDPEMADDASS